MNQILSFRRTFNALVQLQRKPPESGLSFFQLLGIPNIVNDSHQQSSARHVLVECLYFVRISMNHFTEFTKQSVPVIGELTRNDLTELIHFLKKIPKRLSLFVGISGLDI